MWSKSNIGLYASYAAVGLCDSLVAGTARPFCYYAWPEANNTTCSVAQSTVQIAWTFKLIIAFTCEGFQPFGMRRKAYIVGGWAAAIFTLLILAIFAESLSFPIYILTAALFEFFMMIADVNADGYTVQLSQAEPLATRGNILATGQLCRFVMCMVGGLLQSFLLNGPTTNPPGKGFDWGLTVGELYWVLAAVAAVMLLPTLYYFDETAAPQLHEHTSMRQNLSSMWEVLHDVCLFSIMVWSLGSNVIAGATNRVGSSVIEGGIVELSGMMMGLDNVTTYLTLCVGIWLFKHYLIRYNWRWTQIWTTVTLASLNLAWLIPALDRSSAARSPWLCIFIDSSEQFVQGITQVMMSMAIVELAPVGLEATCYELLVSVANSFITLNVVVSTQLMGPFKLSQVGVGDHVETDQDDTNMAYYTLLITGINIVGVLTSVWFFPKNPEQCHIWKASGGRNSYVAVTASVFATVTVVYAVVCCILGLFPSTSCLTFIGGNGCDVSPFSNSTNAINATNTTNVLNPLWA